MSKIFNIIGIWVMLLVLHSCSEPDPKVNTPTSGKMVLYVDEMYSQAIQDLADSFKKVVPKSEIKIISLSGRVALERLFLDQKNIATNIDTSSTTAAIVGRGLIKDEQELLAKTGIAIKEYPIANDGIAIAVAKNSVLQETTKDNLMKCLSSVGLTYTDLDSGKGSEKINFVMPDQYSSTLPEVMNQMTQGKNINAYVQYFSTADSVLNAVANSKSISMISWYKASLDSQRVKTLRLGWADSNAVYPPAPVHPSTLVMGRYPIKQTLTGYTFAISNSLSIGFLAWVSKSRTAQTYLTNKGMQGLNIKFKLTEPESWQGTEDVEDVGTLLNTVK